MAGAKIRGITLEIGGDTSGLTKALKDVNGDLKNTQKQLKDVEKLLKLDPKNTELLAQKQKLLTDRVEETSKKLDELKRIQQTMDDNGVDKNSEQYMALQREIVSTEIDLKNAKKALKEFSGVKLEAVKAQLKEIGKKADEVAQKTRGISIAAAGAVAGLGAMAYKSIQNADELNTLAKQTGFTTSELQKFQYAAELVDVSMEDITSASKKLKKAMTSGGGAADAFETLGINVRDANGELRDMRSVFYETLDRLSKVANETERDALAMQIFGKSADELAGIVDDGGKALKEFGEEAEKAGLILDEETLSKLNETNDEIDRLKATALMTLTELGAKLTESLLPILEKVFTKVDQFLEWLGKLDGDTLATIGTILLFAAALSPVASGISAISNAIIFLVSNPIVLLVAAIVALAALIAVKGDEIQAKLGEVDDYITNVFSHDWTEQFGIMGEVLNTFQGYLAFVWNNIKTQFDGIIDFIRGIFTGNWERVWHGVYEIFDGMFGGILSSARNALNSVISLVNMVIGHINSLIGAINSLIGFTGLRIGNIGKIPFMANGGVLTHGSAIVGEAGAELLTVNQGKATVTPLGGGGSGAPINITVKSVLDGRIVGESTYKYIHNRERAYGV